jgi:phosphoserine phosphatase
MAENVLTLIAPPQATLPEAMLPAATDALKRLGASVARPDWLARGTAVDLLFEDLDPDQADAAVRAALAETAPDFDLVAQPTTGRRKRLLVADLESTIIANEMLDELADLIGLRAEVSAITRRAMNDEIDFRTALRERVALLAGEPEAALAQAARRIRVAPGAETLVATMRANGAGTVLVSGGFHVFADPVAALLGFDRVFANDLVIADGRIAGIVREPVLGREDKLARLKSACADLGIPLALSLAVGDGANDIPMIEAAGLGVAYHAKPAVVGRARTRIDHADLTALLHVQGYRREEFVSGR